MDTPAPSRRTLARRIVLGLLFAAAPGLLRAQDPANAPASTAGTLARPPAPSQQQVVSVPDLSGRTVDEARRLLAAAGLEVGSVAEGDGGGTPGTVIDQQPRAGSAVAPKSDVRLWLAPQAATAQERPTLSRPPVTRPSVQIVTVPRLAGRTVEDARATLARVNLQVGAVAEEAGRGAPGTIVRQSPRPGMPVVPGSSVRVWIVPARVAQQPREAPAEPLVVRVPNVVGQTVDDARETLRAAGLTPGTLAEAAGAGAPGTVSRQQPAAGAATLPNARVGLWLVPARTAAVAPVATRPDPPPQRPQPQPPVQPPPARDTAVAATQPAAPAVDSMVVPDVRRLALSQAQAELAAAGLAAVVDAALVDSAGWTVSAQQPSPGARLAAGSRVALLLDPPAPVAAATSTQPPVAGPPPPPAAAPAEWGRRTLWMGLAALLLVVAAAAVGARRMRAGKSVPPVAAVSARLRMDTPARVAVEGSPLGEARLRFRMSPGRTAARVAAAGSLFVQKEVSGD